MAEKTTKPTTTQKRASNKAPKNFDMLKAIREEKLYKSNVQRRDVVARKFVDENYDYVGKVSVCYYCL